MVYDVLAVLHSLPGEDLEGSAERLLSAFEATHPETGAVTSVDLRRRTFDVAFTVESSDVYGAFELAQRVFAQGAGAAGIVHGGSALDAFHVDVTSDVDAPVAVPA